MKRKRVKLDRLRAAYQAGQFGSWLRLATIARVSHPTLSRLVNRRIKAVNPRTLERLAEAMRVPSYWLTGELKSLPYVPEWSPIDRERKGPSRWEKPTADDVRHSWLVQRVEAAVRRDLREWYAEDEDARAAYDSWGHGLLSAFVDLSSSLLWRVAVFQPSLDAGSGDVWHGSDDSRSQDWLMHILEPWFLGRAYLNADVLRGLFAALQGNPEGELFRSDIRDADMLRALERYAAACDEYAPNGARFDRSLVRKLGRRAPATPKRSRRRPHS